MIKYYKSTLLQNIVIYYHYELINLFIYSYIAYIIFLFLMPSESYMDKITLMNMLILKPKLVTNYL